MDFGDFSISKKHYENVVVVNSRNRRRANMATLCNQIMDVGEANHADYSFIMVTLATVLATRRASDAAVPLSKAKVTTEAVLEPATKKQRRTVVEEQTTRTVT